VPYLHCPDCRCTAWLHANGEPGVRCRDCDAELTPMPAGQARSLLTTLRERFARDAALDSGHSRFVRD
jgi:ribosomal protein S27E